MNVAGAREGGAPIRGARARAQALRGRIERRRPDNRVVDAGFRLLHRDKTIAGGVLGGGLAYRLFFLTLAYAVLFFGALGFADPSDTDEVGREVGLSQALVDTIAEASEQSQSGRWWLLLSGVALVLWTSWSLFRALRLVQAAAWREAAPRARNAPLEALLAVTSVVGMILFAMALGWLREQGDVLGDLIAWLGGIAFFSAAWAVISQRLPSREVPLVAHLPGAALFGVGIWALHVFSVVYLSDKLANASAVYGALGLAATALFVLYLIGRGIVWAGVLNAVVWEMHEGRAGG